MFYCFITGGIIYLLITLCVVEDLSASQSLVKHRSINKYKYLTQLTYKHKTFPKMSSTTKTPRVCTKPIPHAALIQPPPEMNILTPTFIHAPGLGPNLKGVRFSLDGPVSWGVLDWESRQRLRGRWGRVALTESGCQGRVHRRVCVRTPVAGNTMLGAVLAVLSWQLLLEKQINIIWLFQIFCTGAWKLNSEMTDRRRQKL